MKPLFLLLLTGLCCTPSWSAAPSSGVILVYHHVSTDTPPSTSLSPVQFREHMQYLKAHHIVLPLPEMLNKLQTAEPLPDKAVAITFDDGYQNILHNAHPILQEYQFPYTLFINPDLIGQQAHQLDWSQVKQLHQQGVSFANHSSQHRHLLTRLPGETEHAWLTRTMQDILAAEARLEKQLGSSLKLLAYPYGEYNLALSQAIQKHGFIGLGQHSGAVASFSNFGALPRFPAAGIYANLNSLKTKLTSLAMPVVEIKQPDPELDVNPGQPEQTLVLESKDLRIHQLRCFFKGAALEVNKQGNSVHLSPPGPLSPGRARVNCTVPSVSQLGRYYWYSQPWFVPTENGQWLD